MLIVGAYLDVSVLFEGVQEVSFYVELSFLIQICCVSKNANKEPFELNLSAFTLPIISRRNIMVEFFDSTRISSSDKS